jgi:hypothetical protein
MKALFKILGIIACLGVLSAAMYLLYPTPTSRPVVPGGNDTDTVRQNAVDTMDKAISDANAQRHVIDDYQRRK